MDKFDRIFHLHKILASRRTAIPLDDLMARLECSKSTLHRAINVTAGVIALVLAYFYLDYVLLLFPWTRALGQNLVAVMLRPLTIQIARLISFPSGPKTLTHAGSFTLKFRFG